MEKINIAEILKDCPKGTKLYSLVHGEVELTRVGVECIYCIPNYLKHYEIEFNLDGRWIENMGECILFPSKENRDWTKFQRLFKDGDVITCTNSICSFVAIFKEIQTNTTFIRYVSLTLDDEPHFAKEGWADFRKPRFATEEEKEKLFKAIKDNGYKWNAETKTLEKLPKFKVGDRIKSKISNAIYTVVDIKYGEYHIKSDSEKYPYQIPFESAINYELVPNKFDITTLKPFDKVLVRDTNEQKWTVDMFSFYDKDCVYPFSCIGHYTNQCIPYEGNEHLLGTTNNCNEHFKTWE